MENVDVYALLNELQEEIDQSRSSAFSKNKSVDPEVINEIIADIRKALDETLQYAHEIESTKDQLLADAHSQAETILKEAKLKAQDMVSESSVTRAAHEQSIKIVDKAKQKAADMKRQSLEYVDDVFNDLEQYYKESLDVLHENETRLQAKREQ